MATISTNLEMTLPESFDKVDISVISQNFSLIDKAFEKVIEKEAIVNSLETEDEGKVLGALFWAQKVK